MKRFFCIVFVIVSFVGCSQGDQSNSLPIAGDENAEKSVVQATVPRFIELVGHTGYEHSYIMYDEVYCIVFSPDGKKVATSAQDSTVRIWDAESGKELRKFDAHSLFVSFSPDGRKICVSTRIYDIESGKELQRFENRVSTISSNWKKYVSFDKDRIGHVFDLESGKELQKFGEKNYSFDCSPIFSPDSKIIVVCGYDGTDHPTHIRYSSTPMRDIRIFDVDSGKELHRIEGFPGIIRSVAFSPDGKKIAIGSPFSSVRIFDVASGKELHNSGGFNNSGTSSVAFSPDGKKIVAVSSSVQLWDAESGKELQNLSEIVPIYVRSVSFSSDGKKVGVAGAYAEAGILVLE